MSEPRQVESVNAYCKRLGLKSTEEATKSYSATMSGVYKYGPRHASFVHREEISHVIMFLEYMEKNGCIPDDAKEAYNAAHTFCLRGLASPAIPYEDMREFVMKKLPYPHTEGGLIIWE